MSGTKSFWCRVGWHAWQLRPGGGAICRRCLACRHRWERDYPYPRTLSLASPDFWFCRDCTAWDVDEP